MVNRREAKAIGRLAGHALNKAGEKLEESVSKDHARRLEEARSGENAAVRAYRESADMLRRQAEGFLAKAEEAEAAGKASKAARLRKGAERPMRQADEWDRKAQAEAQRLREWAAERE